MAGYTLDPFDPVKRQSQYELERDRYQKEAAKYDAEIAKLRAIQESQKNPNPFGRQSATGTAGIFFNQDTVRAEQIRDLERQKADAAAAQAAQRALYERLGTYSRRADEILQDEGQDYGVEAARQGQLDTRAQQLALQDLISQRMTMAGNPLVGLQSAASWGAAGAAGPAGGSELSRLRELRAASTAGRGLAGQNVGALNSAIGQGIASASSGISSLRGADIARVSAERDAAQRDLSWLAAREDLAAQYRDMQLREASGLTETELGLQGLTRDAPGYRWGDLLAGGIKAGADIASAYATGPAGRSPVPGAPQELTPQQLAAQASYGGPGWMGGWR